MSNMDLSHVRTFALIGHGGDGKTTLADSSVMATGITDRPGSVEDGSSFMNFLPEEKSRRVSIATSICSFEHDGYRLNLLDTPGDANFAGETRSAIQAVDHVILVLSAQDGIKVGSEKTVRLARECGLGVSVIANKMDSGSANFGMLAKRLEEAFGLRVVKLHLPLGHGDSYAGYIDLLAQKAHHFALDGSGQHTSGEIPDALRDDTETARMEMIEAIAEGDDATLEKYLEQGTLEYDEILTTLRKGVRDGKLMPLLSAAASLGIGGHALLDTAIKVLPSPTEAPMPTARAGEEALDLEANPDGPVVAYVFKSVTDRYTGMLSIFRVYSGTVSADVVATNSRSGNRERLHKILKLQGEHTTDVREVGPGGIAAVAKLHATHTGDTLGPEKTAIAVDASPTPRGVISFAVEAEKGEEDKVFDALNRLAEEDPSLTLGRDERTHEFLLTGLGQLHIEVTLDKLHRIFNVDLKLKPPKVPYQETIRGRAERVEGKLKKQSGGRGQYGVCFLTVEPGPRGSGVDFVDEIVGGSIPRQFIAAVEKGVRERCNRGIIAGYPVTDVIVRCVDGKHHAVDSSEQAFKTAASIGMKAAFQAAKPTLLEPLMHLEVLVTDDHVGDVMGNLNSRRGKVAGVDQKGSMQVIRAEVPMAEVLTYASDLTSMTGGKGSFTMDFAHYDEVPKETRDKLIAEVAKDKEE